MLKQIALAATVAALSTQTVYAGSSEAKKWVNDEFQPSAISKSDQMKEMEWFINAAKPFKFQPMNMNPRL
jgi:glycerol transport system substrate-binding protein